MSSLSTFQPRKMSEEGLFGAAQQRGGSGSRSRQQSEASGNIAEAMQKAASLQGEFVHMQELADPNFDALERLTTYMRQKKDHSINNYSGTATLATLEKLEAEIMRMYSDVLKGEDEAKGRLRRAVHRASSSKSQLRFTSEACDAQLEEAHRIVQDGKLDLNDVLGPLRSATAEKRALELGRNAALLMLGKNEGVGVEDAAGLLARLELVVREAAARSPSSERDRESMQRALSTVQGWSLDLEKTISQYFFRGLERDDQAGIDTMAQCARASAALNGGFGLIENFVSAVPMVSAPFQQIKAASLAMDPVAKSVVEGVFQLTQKIVQAVEEQAKRVEQIFPHPSLVFEALITELFAVKLGNAVHGVLDDLHAHAEKCGARVASLEGAARSASGRPAPANPRNADARREAAFGKRRYLVALSEINTLVADCAHELGALRPRFGAQSVQVGTLLDDMLSSRRRDYLEEETSYVAEQIVGIYGDVLALRADALHDESERYQKIRTSIAKVSAFGAMTETAIRTCLDALMRCQGACSSDREEASMEAIAGLFIDKFVLVADLAVAAASRILVDGELSMDAEVWTLGPGPVGDYLSLLAVVNRAVSSVDSFLTTCGSDPGSEDAGVQYLHLLSVATVKGLRQTLRRRLVALELEAESQLTGAVTAIASRVGVILDRKGKQATDYNIQAEDDTDVGSVLLVSTQLKKMLERSRSTPVLGPDVFSHGDSFETDISSRDLQLLASNSEGTSASFSRGCAFLEQQVSLIKASLESGSAHFAMAHLAMATRRVVLEHWTGLPGPISALGATKLMRDACALLGCFPSYREELMVLVEVGDLFIAPPDDIWRVVEGSSLQTLDGAVVAALLRRRPDYETTMLWKLAQALEAFTPQSLEDEHKSSTSPTWKHGNAARVAAERRAPPPR